VNEQPYKDIKALGNAVQNDLGKEEVGQLFKSPNLVFTHNDLNMRNILLAPDRTVWIIDWAWAGFYPPWFEQVSMITQAPRKERFWLWRLMVPFILGPTSEESRIWFKVNGNVWM
jgi:thiamine kinase-like enzyme